MWDGHSPAHGARNSGSLSGSLGAVEMALLSTEADDDSEERKP
jgi:hypothetical protein